MGDTSPASSMYLHKSIRENLSALLIFLSLCQTFCDLPDRTSMVELTELRRLYFTIICFFILIHIICTTDLQWGNWGSHMGEDLGRKATSCKVRWLPLMPLLSHLLWVLRDAGICETPFQSLLLYCHEWHNVLEKESAWWRYDIPTSIKVRDLVGHISWDICFTLSQINSLIQSEKIGMVFLEISRYVYTPRAKNLSSFPSLPTSFSDPLTAS